MKVFTLSNNEAGPSGFTHKINITAADLTMATANTAQVINLLSVRAGMFVDRAAYALRTAFKHAADSAFNTTTLMVGSLTVDDNDKFLASNTAGTGMQLNENGTEVFYHINPVAASTAGLATAPFMFIANDTIIATFGSQSGKSLSNIDVGEVDIFLRVVDLAAL